MDARGSPKRKPMMSEDVPSDSTVLRRNRFPSAWLFQSVDELLFISSDEDSSESPALKKEPPYIREFVASIDRSGYKNKGSLGREPRFEKEPPSIHVAAASILLQNFKTNVRGAKARTQF